LGYNRIGEAGATTIGSALQSNRVLQALELRNFCSSVRHTSTAVYFYSLTGNSAGDVANASQILYSCQ
jgi:hypothetical protein